MYDKSKMILDEYLKNISLFYTMVAEWANNKSFFFKEVQHNIHEKASGEYTTKKLLVYKEKNNQIAEICPVGAWIIGANGRIDLIGNFDQQILIYLKKNKPAENSPPISINQEGSHFFHKGVDQDGWYWIEDKKLGKAHAVNKDLFFDLLAEVSDDGF